MRFFPIFTAIATIAVLFMLVFERERVLEFAGIAPGPEGTAAEQADADAAETAETGAEADDAGPAGVSVIAMESRAREIDSAVVLRGRTEAARSVDLLAETSGRVISPPRPKGSMVAAGDVLCEIDLGTRDASLAEARARLAEAEANAPTAGARVAEAEARFAEAETNLSNAERLAADGFATESRVIAERAALESARATLTAAQAGAAGAEAAIEAARAAVARAERDIENTKIAAPFDGVLESDTAELGSLLQPGALCARVLDLDPIHLVGFVSEVDVDRVTVGANVGARLSSGKEVIGKVTFLSRSADETTRTFRVEAEVANADLAIRDGQTAEILVQSQGRMAHLLPQSALTLDDGGDLGVRIVETGESGDIARFAGIDILRDTREGIWVAGLPETAKVIVVGQEYVTDGVSIRVTMRESGS